MVMTCILYSRRRWCAQASRFKERGDDHDGRRQFGRGRASSDRRDGSRSATGAWVAIFSGATGAV
eukprot:COSAG02_NODE_53729_length_300_cov_0.656716_1_plen_64_part_01